MDTMKEKIVRKLIFDYETQIYRELIRNNQEMQQIQRERLEIAHNYPFILTYLSVVRRRMGMKKSEYL